MTEPKPRSSIRRFDVFAEYNRVKAMKEKRMRAAKAKGYGLWLAKVVAARKFRREPKTAEGRERKEPKLNRQGWYLLGGKPQTDALFDHEIVERMGATFYRKVFAPAIRKAYEAGEDYVAIRDRIRAGWKAERARAG
jgi:hypothetical protein